MQVVLRCLTAFRVALLVLVIGTPVFLSPKAVFGEYPTPGYPKSLAGRKILSVPADPFMTVQQEQRILEALQRPAKIQWVGTSPAYLAKELAAYFPCELNVRALDDLGLDPGLEMSLPNVDSSTSLGSNLLQLLQSQDLTFNIQGGRMVLTTLEDSEAVERLPVRIYDVTPLVVMERDGKKIAMFNDLMNSIESVIDPTSWESMGGMSVIRSSVVRDRVLLSVSAPTVTHLKVQAYLDQANAGPDTPSDQWLYVAGEELEGARCGLGWPGGGIDGAGRRTIWVDGLNVPSSLAD